MKAALVLILFAASAFAQDQAAIAAARETPMNPDALDAFALAIIAVSRA